MNHKEKTFNYVDKSGWPAGPWMNEPDKVQFHDEKSGYTCLIVRGPVGALCGYVGVPEGHKFFGMDYDNIDVDVHWGLTFSDFCQENDKEHGICHVAYPGEPDRVWWLGFDCGHCGDLTPKYSFGGDTYRDINYVKRQCLKLAAQL